MQTPNLNLLDFQNFVNLTFFTNLYSQFLNLFPAPTQWLVSVIVLISILAAFFVLIRTHWLFLILLILLLPFIYPVLLSFFGGIWQFVLFLWGTISNGIPKI